MSEPVRGNVSLRPSELVIAAIHNLKERKGSSPNDIISFISKKYELDTEQVKNHVEKALKRGVCFGVLSENEGLYRLLNLNMARIAGEALKKKRVVQRARRGGKSRKLASRARGGNRRKSRVSEFQQRCHMLRGKGRKREKRNSKRKIQRRRPRNKMTV